MRRIAILTGTRADYGLLKQLAIEAEADPRVELALIVSGTHLSSNHGETVSEVVADGLPIAARIPVWSGDDSPVAAARDFGQAVGAYAAVVNELAPEVIVVLGDRLEALAMASAATIVGIPVAHIHGGELTEGAMDDALRHSITKLAALHFTTTAEHARRVRQLGERPEHIFTLGAPVLDAIEQLDFLDAAALELRFGVTVDHRAVLLTFHPAAYDSTPAIEELRDLLCALESVPDIRLVITGTNSDIGSEEIRAELERFIGSHAASTSYVESFGQLGYLSAMRLAGLVVGNSSSTVLEAPLLGVPSVLIGERQRGRPLSASVILPEPGVDAIRAAIELGLSEDFRGSLGDESVFGLPGFAKRALEVLATHDLPRPPRKHFVDLDFTERNSNA